MNTTGTLLGALLLMGAVLTLGCTGGSRAGSSISLTDPAVGAVPGESAAVYLDIGNSGSDDSLVGAHCECAAVTSLHTVEDRDGISMMVATDALDLPSDSNTVLDPGASHLMLEGLVEPLRAGTSVELTLEFEHAAERTIEVPVVDLEELAERVEAPR